MHLCLCYDASRQRRQLLTPLYICGIRLVCMYYTAHDTHTQGVTWHGVRTARAHAHEDTTRSRGPNSQTTQQTIRCRCPQRPSASAPAVSSAISPAAVIRIRLQSAIAIVMPSMDHRLQHSGGPMPVTEPESTHPPCIFRTLFLLLLPLSCLLFSSVGHNNCVVNLWASPYRRPFPPPPLLSRPALLCWPRVLALWRAPVRRAEAQGGDSLCSHIHTSFVSWRPSSAHSLLTRLTKRTAPPLKPKRSVEVVEEPPVHSSPTVSPAPANFSCLISSISIFSLITRLTTHVLPQSALGILIAASPTPIPHGPHAHADADVGIRCAVPRGKGSSRVDDRRSPSICLHPSMLPHAAGERDARAGERGGAPRPPRRASAALRALLPVPALRPRVMAGPTARGCDRSIVRRSPRRVHRAIGVAHSPLGRQAGTRARRDRAARARHGRGTNEPHAPEPEQRTADDRRPWSTQRQQHVWRKTRGERGHGRCAPQFESTSVASMVMSITTGCALANVAYLSASGGAEEASPEVNHLHHSSSPTFSFPLPSQPPPDAGATLSGQQCLTDKQRTTREHQRQQRRPRQLM
jgi:hypothetical protein